MSVLQNILPYVSLINKKLDYVKTDSTYFIFELKGYKLPKNIIDKNMAYPDDIILKKFV